MSRTLLALCAAALAAAPLAAQRWTVDDILLAESAGQVMLSPDARLAVWVKTHMDREKGESVSNLILRDLADGYEVELTRGSDNNGSPRFSPDGKKIAYLSSRKAPDAPASDAPQGLQVWLIDIRGGEPYPVTQFQKGVRSVNWIDRDTLLLTAPEDASLYEQQTKTRKDTSQVVDDEVHAPPVRLFRFDLKSRTASRLSDNPDRIAGVNVSPDGKWAVTIHDRSLRYIYDQKIKPATFIYDLKTGRGEQLFANEKLYPARVHWSPDSKFFYFMAPYTTHPEFYNASVERLYTCSPEDRKAVAVDLGWQNGLFDLAPLPDGFLALLSNGVRPRAARYTRDGAGYRRTWIEGEHASNLFGLETSDDGKVLAYRYSTGDKPGQWYTAALEGAALKDPKPLTAVNGGFAKKAIAKVETVTWKGARDEQVEGLLFYPHHWKAGRKYPLIALIHGGPHGADMDSFPDSWANPVQLLAQKGAFVLKVNYHGSSQYGLQWGESIAGGNYNELEWIDVEKGVDSMIARGFADPEKLGVMGWSNGSIITIELTTRTTRYKVASAGAGDVNWTSDWGNAVFGHSFDAYYLGKTPMEDPALYIKKSPLFRMDKVRTPTIIFFGTEDKQVPTEQGWQHYRALEHYGKAEVRFLLFPGEAHGPRKFWHLRRKMEEEQAWFDKYLFGTAGDRNEALKPESALAAAIKLKNVSSVPETVERGPIAIGRFEVTRAQFAAFDATYRYAPGTDLYPATGITFDQAKRYCEWLSTTSGQKFRLGTEEEMSAHLKPAKGENTLDQWAGYDVNSDDARKLASLVEGLGPGALLRPVGSYAGQGDDPVYDLGGNAAEWVVAKDGSGKVLGGSADRPADAKSLTAARSDYVGFRVVREL